MLKICLFIGILASQVCWATPTLVISDIDDTLKESHVLNKINSLVRANQTRPFEGMAQLLQAVVSTHPETHVYYVSASPKLIMSSRHRKFLKDNQFPQGELILRKNIIDGNFKVQKISEILQEEQPTDVLLLGDNGEKDTTVYLTLQTAFPQIRFTTLIHQVYSSRLQDDAGKALEKNQIGFVTAMDGALVLHTENWISEENLEPILSLESGLTDHKGNAFIPKWMNCSDYHPVQEVRDQVPQLASLLLQICK